MKKILNTVLFVLGFILLFTLETIAAMLEFIFTWLATGFKYLKTFLIFLKLKLQKP
jgi:hypothetical protein